MSGQSDTPPVSPSPVKPPVEGAAAPHVPKSQIPEPQIPDVPIPHMGTSTASQPTQATPAPAAEQAATLPQSQPSPMPQSPPLPEGVTQDAVDAAIRQVEQSGTTDGIAPSVLAAACAQIEAQARAHGIDLNAPVEGQLQGSQPAQGNAPGNYVEAAVMDRQSTFDNFRSQREQLKSQVAAQRDAAQQPYRDALAKAQGNAAGTLDEIDLETVKALAEALRDLDPDTIALINAMGVLTDTPGVLKSIVWMEVIRAIRTLIANEARHQLDDRLRQAPPPKKH